MGGRGHHHSSPHRRLRIILHQNCGEERTALFSANEGGVLNLLLALGLSQSCVRGQPDGRPPGSVICHVCPHRMTLLDRSGILQLIVVDPQRGQNELAVTLSLSTIFSFFQSSLFCAKNFCRKSAKEINYFALNWGFCRYPIIIIIFFRYPIDYSPSPLYCYLFRRCPTAPSLLITKFLSSQLNLMF